MFKHEVLKRLDALAKEQTAQRGILLALTAAVAEIAANQTGLPADVTARLKAHAEKLEAIAANPAVSK